MITVSSDLEDLPWEEWRRRWIPDDQVTYTIHEPRRHNREVDNFKALHALVYLALNDLIIFEISEDDGCVIRFLRFPTQLSADIEKYYHEMFLFQNWNYSFYYICLMNCWINPVSTWQRMWSKRFMLTPLTMIPSRVRREVYGYPTCVQDAIHNFEPLDYWDADQDWIVQSTIMQRKIGGPSENISTKENWMTLSYSSERALQASLFQASVSGRIYFEHQISFSVRYMHERFDCGDYILSDQLYQSWHQLMTDPRCYLLCNPFHDDIHAIRTEFQPKHDIPNQKQRFDSYVLTTKSLSLTDGGIFYGNFNEPGFEVGLTDPSDDTDYDSDRSPKGNW